MRRALDLHASDLNDHIPGLEPGVIGCADQQYNVGRLMNLTHVHSRQKPRWRLLAPTNSGERASTCSSSTLMTLLFTTIASSCGGLKGTGGR